MTLISSIITMIILQEPKLFQNYVSVFFFYFWIFNFHIFVADCWDSLICLWCWLLLHHVFTLIFTQFLTRSGKSWVWIRFRWIQFRLLRIISSRRNSAFMHRNWLEWNVRHSSLLFLIFFFYPFKFFCGFVLNISSTTNFNSLFRYEDRNFAR